MLHAARKATGRVALAALLLAVALVLMLAQGATSVRAAIVNGRSMLPGIRSGDLVIVQRQTAYAVGDIVLYRSGTTSEVLHRIKRLEQGTFVLQGDNNPTEDSARPTLADLRGRLLLRIPEGGRYIQSLQSPLVGTLILSVTLLGFIPSRRTRSRRLQEAMMSGSLLTIEGLPGQLLRLRPVQVAITIALTSALAASMLAWYAESGLPAQAVPISSEIRHLGTFTYAASTSSDDPLLTTVTTGKPLYVRITDGFTVDYRYRYEADRPIALRGSTSLLARVRADDGWTADLTSTPEVPLDGDGKVLRLKVDLREANAAVRRLESGTGVRFPLYYLDVVSTTRVAGQAGDSPVSFEFTPELTFRMDGNGLRLERGAQRQGSVLEPRDTQTITQTITRPREFAVFGLRFVPSAIPALPLALWGIAAIALGSAMVTVYAFSRMPLHARLSNTGLGMFLGVGQLPPDAVQSVPVNRLQEFIRLSAGEPILVGADGAGQVFLTARGDRWYEWRPPHLAQADYRSTMRSVVRSTES